MKEQPRGLEQFSNRLAPGKVDKARGQALLPSLSSRAFLSRPCATFLQQSRVALPSRHSVTR